jgi:hypothetical protein
MLPQAHLRHSTVAALGLAPILKTTAFWFWLGGIFIDADHYFWYVWQFRDFNPWHAYQYLRRLRTVPGQSQDPRPVVIFHTVEVLLGIGLLAFRCRWGLALFGGMIFHMLLDFIEDISVHRCPDREYSLAGVFIDRWRRRAR